RTPVHQSVLADVKVARTRTTAPFVGFSTRDIMLELVEPRIRPLSKSHHLLEDSLLVVAQRLQLAIAIVQHADRAGEAQLQCAPRHLQRIFRKSYAAAHHGVD